MLFVGGGILYVYFADRTNNAHTQSSISNQPVLTLPKPTLPAADAREGAFVETVTSPVSQGQNSSITINTNAGSICSIIVTYNGVKSTDSGLTPKTADQNGTITWTWTVDSSVPVGNWPISVTCVYHGRSAVVDSSVQVVK